jgi:hypothetical protein
MGSFVPSAAVEDVRANGAALATAVNEAANASDIPMRVRTDPIVFMAVSPQSNLRFRRETGVHDLVDRRFRRSSDRERPREIKPLLRTTVQNVKYLYR